MEKRRRGESEAIASLSRSISPPRKRQRQLTTVKSPWQLTWIRDLPDSENKDALTLNDLLGDPLISECWQFNYLHDLDFVMNAFDPDTRHLVKVNIVHGFWKREDANRLRILEQASRFPNVSLHVAPMPEAFGTHHSKMMILFRHDETAQVIIHTANMIEKDWTNMTNGVWKTPLLPPINPHKVLPGPKAEIGDGRQFQHDLLRYLRCYNARSSFCTPLIDRLGSHDFGAVQGILIASVPGRHDMEDTNARWGWNALQKSLIQLPKKESQCTIAVQVSSIATLGATDGWLRNTLFKSLSGSTSSELCKFQIVFPTADEIRRSLDGYASGASIHTKVQSKQQVSQLQYLKPLLHHWANDSLEGQDLPIGAPKVAGGRDRAAPHIKTYIRYNEAGNIDWALLTSANMSKQAWGEAVNSAGDMRVASWEIGVLMWPELYESNCVMKGAFRTDTPEESDTDTTELHRVGLRVPYSLPLQQYGSDEIPWVASVSHPTPDCFGRQWIVD